ncbi:MAG: amidase [Burkholderiaceae bacterium]|nr:amidase [Burkholderiaceae bacterium]MCD8536452.1 amidase [Burkholderiaceae bacterium]MCD8565269.1 amidase [Burkholderiaceae bacterium]
MQALASRNVDVAFANIEHWNSSLNALFSPNKAMAIERASVLDDHAVKGIYDGVLAGMTISIKDNIDWVGAPTTAASPLYANRYPERNAFVVDRLLEQGAILVGKANLHELVFGPTSQSKHYGPVRNPWNLAHIAGGSSGGSGASVASNMCQASIGSDTAGSIRIPAAFNGVCGLRPTSGRVSNQGTIAVSAKFDTLGPLARRVQDVARVFYAIAQHDPQDPCSEHYATPMLPTDWGDIRGLRIGIPKNFFFDDITPEVKAAVGRASAELASLGAQLIPINLDGVEQAQEMLAFRIILADAFNLYRERLASNPEAFGDDLKIRFDIGAKVSGWEYAQALRWVEQWRHTLTSVFMDVDVILTPTIAMPAPTAADLQFGNAIRSIPRFTCAFAAAGIPSMAMPCGFSSEGLPLSMQLASSWGNEDLLFDVGAAYQSVTDFHMREPRLPETTS